jgi:hypothetical protein
MAISMTYSGAPQGENAKCGVPVPSLQLVPGPPSDASWDTSKPREPPRFPIKSARCRGAGDVTTQKRGTWGRSVQVTASGTAPSRGATAFASSTVLAPIALDPAEFRSLATVAGPIKSPGHSLVGAASDRTPSFSVCAFAVELGPHHGTPYASPAPLEKQAACFRCSLDALA